jgi:hypothetical protein
VSSLEAQFTPAAYTLDLGPRFAADYAVPRISFRAVRPANLKPLSAPTHPPMRLHHEPSSRQLTPSPPFSAARRWLATIVLAAAGAFLPAPSAEGSVLVQQMRLDTLCGKAARIFRGTVIDISTGALRAGGGNLPTVTYTLRVTETLAGDHEETLRLTMVGELKPPPRQPDGLRRATVLDLPRLTQGQEYLLFTTRPSRLGFSTTVGLGQGCFLISQKGDTEYAVNAANNAGLGLPQTGPVEYESLTRRIRAYRARAARSDR